MAHIILCDVCGKPEKGYPKHPPDTQAIICSHCVAMGRYPKKEAK